MIYMEVKVTGIKLFEAFYVDGNVGPATYKGQPKNTLLVTKIFDTIQGEGPFAGTLATFIRLAGCNRGDKVSMGCQFCFPGSMEVVTKRGKIRMDLVKVGDFIKTLDDDFQVVWTRVVRIMSRLVDKEDMVRLTYKTDLGSIKGLTCTKDHPFNTTRRGFVKACELREGEMLRHSKRGKSVALWQRTNNSMFNNLSVRKMLRTKIARNQYGKSRLEVKLELLFKEWGMLIKYVGNDRNFIIGDQKSGYKIPDFVVEGSNKVIEVFNESVKKRTYGSVRMYVKERVKHFERFGWNVLTISLSDFDAPGSGYRRSYSDLKRKLGNYITNGIYVVSVKPLGDGLYSGKKREVFNFECEPFNSYCIIDGIHVHNCDTDFRFANGVVMTFDEIIGKLKYQLVIITGGEPMMQDNLSYFVNMIDEDWDVQIESNGDRLAKGFPEEGANLVVSPKANKSGYKRLPKPVLDRLDYLKFLIDHRPESPYYDVPNIEAVIGMNYVEPDRIFISPITVYKRDPLLHDTPSMWDPEVIDVYSTRLNYKRAAELAMKYGYKVSSQQHLFYEMP